jgi:hypothetical protein
MAQDRSPQASGAHPVPGRNLTRREALQFGARTHAVGALPGVLAACGGAEGRAPLADEVIRKPIPVSGEEIPLIGLGTWQTSSAW